MDVSDSDQSIEQLAAGQDDPGKKDFRIPSPPVDWDLNKLLLDIGQEMTIEDLGAAKMMFKGLEGLGRKLLSETKTAFELFDSLQMRCFIDRDNLLYLQGMLYKINRMDLFERVADYASRTLEEAIHFKPPAKEPANGYKYLQFHIEGKDVEKTYTKSSLQDLRATAAKIMGVPQQFIIIAGIEPSASLLITLMIPESFVKYLESALGRSEFLKYLEILQVDTVLIDQTQWKVNGIEAKAIVPNRQQQRHSDIYKKLLDVENKLEESEIMCLKLKRRLKVKETENEGLGDPLKVFLIDMLYRAYSNRKVPQLFKQSALSFYKFCLKQIEILGVNREVKELIHNLLDAYGLVVAIRFQDSEAFCVMRLMSNATELQAKAYQHQIPKPRMQFENRPTELEKRAASFLEKKAEAFLQSRVQVRQMTRIQFGEPVIRDLREISELLSEEEKQQLKDKYVWPIEESLTKRIQQKDGVFLACLLCKEIHSTGSDVDIGDFITKQLKDINREDLVQKFSEMMEKEKTQTSSVELKTIQDQLALVLQKLEHLENSSGKETLSYRPNINVGPLQMDVLNLHMGSERIQELSAELANRKEETECDGELFLF